MSSRNPEWRLGPTQAVAFGVAGAGALGIAAFILVPLLAAQRGNQSFESWYTGVGAKLKRVHQELAERGVAIDDPRPGR